jgi:hypothetical protein
MHIEHHLEDFELKIDRLGEVDIECDLDFEAEYDDDFFYDDSRGCSEKVDNSGWIWMIEPHNISNLEVAWYDWDNDKDILVTPTKEQIEEIAKKIQENFEREDVVSEIIDDRING